MDILYYKDLDYSKATKQFSKTVDYLKDGDFTSADVKKMVNTDFYRAKLDYENRLLFKFARYNDRSYLLLLEVIYNHEYEKSRFLRGAKIDEKKMTLLKTPDKVTEDNVLNLTYVNPQTTYFHLLDKVISFDDEQEELFKINPPVVIIGSAGSGKTVLTLEKLKALSGNVLYVTLSPFLVENSVNLYYSNNYINEKQDIDFLSFKEFLETLKIIKGKELDYKAFEAWIHPRTQAFGIKDTHKIFEEFKGVITGMEITKEYLNRNDYLDLGIKQSIFLSNEREKVYDVFQKYFEFISENNYYDLNMISFLWLEYCRPKYDFIVIDEVQDFTNIQLYIVLKSLKKQDNFILCGDSNQVVHPNFFSWTNVKTMFYKHDISGKDVRILRTNYRNSIGITDLANKLLKIKNARFGSIDKESTYLVDSIASNKGEINFLKDSPKIRKQLNDKTRRSTKYAVLVMGSEDKNETRKIFKTPLLFSIQEAKGLEYENIIIINFVSGNNKEFHEITQGITHEQIKDEDFIFSRGKDKADKSLDAYKFYINSLYVAITRAVKNLYILESSKKHEILNLLDLVETKEKVSLKEEVSSMDEWKSEARKLEMQGKKEQAEEIRKTILSIEKPDWEPITPDNIDELKEQALDPARFNKKAKDKLFAYALLYNDIDSISELSELKYRKADDYEYERNSVYRKYYQQYKSDNVKIVEKNILKYGINYRDQFNLTPLLAAILAGSFKILNFLIENNADTSCTDNFGKNALQIAINQSFFDKGYIQKLSVFYHRFITDNIKIQVDDRLVKIDNHKIEYFLLHFFISLQGAILNTKDNEWEPQGIRAGDIIDVIADYPETVLQEYRKKRSYISANLAKNEIESTNPYNKKLFHRTERGNYVLNPNIDILIHDKWKNVYDLMRIEKVIILTEEEKNEKMREMFARDNEIIERWKREYELKYELKKQEQIDKKKRRKERVERKKEKERKKIEMEEKKKEADKKQYKLPFDKF